MRLTGLSLIAARRFAETAGGARILRQKVFSDYKIHDLLNLPPEARAPLAIHAGPLAQTRRRGWSGKDLALGKSPDHVVSAAELRRAYTAGETTPVEVLRAIRERVESGEFGQATFSPFTCLDFDIATEAAEKSAARYAAGEPLGPLDGIPLPVKDQYIMKGLPVGCGSAYRDEIYQHDAHVVEVLRDAGALIYAKTHTTEWGMNPCGFCSHRTLPRNVYSSDHSAGGSSTGAAVAIALGLAPIATGSDGGGSIRIPAAMNALYGIKPTYVRLGRTGDLFGSSSVTAAGPLAATTSDLVDFMAAFGDVTDPADPARRWGPTPRNLADRFRRALGRGVDGARIGIPRSEWDDLDPALQQPSLDALKELERDGAELVDLDAPLLRHAPAVGVISIGLECVANLQDEFALYQEAFGDELRMSLAMLRTVDATEFLASQRTRAALQVAMRDHLDEVDLIALPTTQTTASEYPADLDGVPIADDVALRAMTRYTFLANITGLPAGSVPVGFHQGLPFGLQFVGGAWDEASIFAAMAHAERQQWAEIPAPQGLHSLL